MGAAPDKLRQLPHPKTTTNDTKEREAILCVRGAVRFFSMARVSLGWLERLPRDRQGADGAFAESFRVDAECVIEAGAIIFPGYGRRQLNQLSFVELRTQACEQRIGNIHRSASHRVGIFEGQLLQLRKKLAALVVGQGLNLFLGDAVLSADRRGDVDSKRTANEGGRAQGR